MIKHGDIEKTGQLEKEIENLKAEIKLLITVVDDLKDMISSLPKALNPTPATFKSPSVSDTYLSITPLNNVDISPPFSNVIPQLDGLQQEFVDHPSQQTSQQLLQCETCKKVFQTSEEYKKHDAFQFCCDDCGICYATQVEADLHALHVHPDETYARNFIPEATKFLFEQQKSAAM